jgi:hypothetical protein
MYGSILFFLTLQIQRTFVHVIFYVVEMIPRSMPTWKGPTSIE